MSPTEPSVLETFQEGVENLQQVAAEMAHDDAASDVPRLKVEGRSESEAELRERCKAFFRRWQASERRKLNDAVTRCEAEIAERLGWADLAVDRIERLADDLARLQGRFAERRRALEEAQGARSLKTRWYVLALCFLGVVELFANAPIFVALLPRDPLTERQIQQVAASSEGWFAGAERVLAQLLMRPDAALLAAGVVTFLLVLAHFFGHSLRATMTREEIPRKERPGSSLIRHEHIVPMVLSGLGLILVLGVLYQARVTLGQVGEDRYREDVARVERLQEEADALRAEGELATAAERASQAREVEEASAELREYAASMSRLSVPIFLLNATLVLCAIAAAYFHRKNPPPLLDETSFEEDRATLLESAEEAAREFTGLLPRLATRLRTLRDLRYERSLTESRALVHELEAVIMLYRAENGRARGIDPRKVPAFAEPVTLDLDVEAEASAYQVGQRRDPADYDRRRQALQSRFEEARSRLREVATGG